jgi:hypothetical protein
MENLKNIELTVIQNGDTFEAKAHTYPHVGQGKSFREAIGDWLYINGRFGTNVTIGGPFFSPEAGAARAAAERAAQQQ